MKVNLTVNKNEELQILIKRTEEAVAELKDCLWELANVRFNVEIDDKNK
jgi:uncharacterized protein involved in tolerance to divalent cations